MDQEGHRTPPIAQEPVGGEQWSRRAAQAAMFGELTTDILVEDLESVETRDEASRSSSRCLGRWCRRRRRHRARPLGGHGVVRDREFDAVSSAAAVRRDQDPHSLHGAKC